MKAIFQVEVEIDDTDVAWIRTQGFDLERVSNEYLRDRLDYGSNVELRDEEGYVVDYPLIACANFELLSLENDED